MVQVFDLLPGVTLRCFWDTRFKHSCLSLQLLQPMEKDRAAMNALLPAVLLRGTKEYPDMRSLTRHLDDLYGAAVGPMVRRIGDWQTTGFYASFTDDRFALSGDRILEPVTKLLRQLLLEPVTDGAALKASYVESEKKNLIATIESQANDKRAWAMEQMIKKMCREDSYGIPRLGDKADVEAITPESLYAHLGRVLRESPVELFYVGSEDPGTVARLAKAIFAGVEREIRPLPAQTGFHPAEAVDEVQTQDVNQGKLCMGFVNPVTCREEGYLALQVFNALFGGGMTSKLFAHIRETLSLCYAIGSGLAGSKGILTVSAGIDSNLDQTVRTEILQQLELCRKGEISRQEMTSAKQAIRSSLLGVHDSPGSIEYFYSLSALSGQNQTPEEILEQLEDITLEDVQKAARETTLHSVFFLKGVEA